MLKGTHQEELAEITSTLAAAEQLDPVVLRKSVTAGRAVISGGDGRQPFAVGENLCAKVNANVGTSTVECDIDAEVRKAQIAEQLGACMISDCSVGEDLDRVRRALLANCNLPVASVPMYQSAAEAGGASQVTREIFYDVLGRQLEDGIRLVVVHLAMDAECLPVIRARTMGMVSRGGLLTAVWMEAQGWEAPLAGDWGPLFEMLNEWGATLVVGNAARSGCVHDRLDDAHRREARLGEKVAKMANAAGVQVIIEAVGGHVHGPDIAEHVRLYKEQGSRPIFAAGPLPVDVAVGHDHLAAVVGGTLAVAAGADLLCYITPAEHICLPNIDDVRDGMNACLVAAYCGDAMRRGPFERDLEFARARRKFDWPTQFALALSPERARERHQPGEECSMCGSFCPMRDPRSISG
ncbi:MAG TPA: phosphomethylpyrimidine synthase ThiC, partial [Candidatus Lokiarchaeia archaeon]|nr:phosphomethylpyrimidine synthase ThiC [Candidatus Lokiarchaeia archaeon]